MSAASPAHARWLRWRRSPAPVQSSSVGAASAPGTCSCRPSSFPAHASQSWPSSFRAVLVFLIGQRILRRFPQPLHVAHGWDTEETFVLPSEVGGVVVAHAIGGTGR